jgi:hypothetical protein
MSVVEDWFLDVTFWRDGEFVFCPMGLDGDSVMIGLTFIGGDVPPNGGRVVGYYHGDGQGAVEAWMAAHPEIVERLTPASRSTDGADTP